MTYNTIDNDVTMPGNGGALLGGSGAVGNDLDAKSMNDAVTMVPGGGLSLGRIDQYELLRELGGGGFGSVYLAKDTVAGIEVAVKGLPPLIRNNAEELERIRENFALVSRLHHPYIAAALHLQLAKEVVYSSEDARQKLRVMPGDTLMVMEYAPGVTLSKWRKQFPDGKVPIEHAVQIAWQIAQALDYAHEHHIIHRDIKPANIMVETRPDGEVVARLLDFGLAAEIRSSMGRVSREIHDTSGTRPYMAPEQWTGRKQGPATDQYSLAVLLYEMLTGEVPFASVFDTGDPMVMMNAVCSQEVEFPEDCPRKAALSRALAKDPSQRFASCMDFLESAAKSEPVPEQGTVSEPTVKNVSGRKVAILVAAGIFIAFAVVGGIVWHNHNVEVRRHERARIVAEREAAVERQTREEVEMRLEEAHKRKEELLAQERKAEAKRNETGRKAEEAGMAREDVECKAKKEESSHIDQEMRKREVARLAELSVDISIKVDDARQKWEEIGAFLSEPDGFQPHIDNAEANWNIVNSVGKSPTSIAEGEALLKTLSNAEGVIARELHWLKANKEERDKAKAVEGEISRVIVPELERFKAEDYARVTYARGVKLRKDGNACLANGDFQGARSKLDESKSKFLESVAEAKAFCMATHLKTAAKWCAAARWQQCVAECDIVLGWDSANAEAKRLKAEAENHLFPSLKLMTKIGEREVTGATIILGGREYRSPYTCERCRDGDTIGPIRAKYTYGGKRYTGNLSDIKIDWKGLKSYNIELKEDIGPNKVQLWEGGPYWADRNVGSKGPWDKGYFFWWGDTVGYTYDAWNGCWIASDGSRSDFRSDSYSSKSFCPKPPSCKSKYSTLERDGWITSDGNLALEHDAAHVHLGGGWRMPTYSELQDLAERCDWEIKRDWGRTNSRGEYFVEGYIVRGRGRYSSSSIVLPVLDFNNNDFKEYWWSSSAKGDDYAYALVCEPSGGVGRAWMRDACRNEGLFVRPVQGCISGDKLAESPPLKQDAMAEGQGSMPAGLNTGDMKLLTLPGGAKMEMIYVAPGSFVMGSSANEDGHKSDETQHRVTLTKGFWLGKYEVTKEQWQSVMVDNPLLFEGKRNPEGSITWDDCQQFIQRINLQTNCGARLPTEAEWEYACRAGTTTAYHWGNVLNGDKANCNGNFPCGTKFKGTYLMKATPVGQYGANPWGFCDMHGNANEWCNDWYGSYSGDTTDPQGPVSGSYRVRRGGGWNDTANQCRSAYRGYDNPGSRAGIIGFRLCCSAGPRE